MPIDELHGRLQHVSANRLAASPAQVNGELAVIGSMVSSLLRVEPEQCFDVVVELWDQANRLSRTSEYAARNLLAIAQRITVPTEFAPVSE